SVDGHGSFMKIVAIRQRTLPVARSARNAAISFESMTVSIVAVVTDQMRAGRPVIGYGVDSAGRYGHGGMLAERFAARVLAAPADSLLTDDGTNFSPERVLAAAMRNEKPGGHGERAGAVGLLDTAIWDIVGKLKDRPLWRVLADGELGLGPRAHSKVPTYAS